MQTNNYGTLGPRFIRILTFMLLKDLKKQKKLNQLLRSTSDEKYLIWDLTYKFPYMFSIMAVKP